jgi:hypothetical protein
MERPHEEYRDHSIELRDDRLLLDGVAIPYGRLPDGQYFLYEYAYDWSDDLAALAQRYIDYRVAADEARRSDSNRGS